MPSNKLSLPDGVELTVGPDDLSDPSLLESVLTPAALELVAGLHREFEGRRRQLMADRDERSASLEAGGTLDFLAETKSVREDDSWKVSPPAPGIEDRRAEITGPTDAKMAINALNSGAKVWLADFEDANTPLFENMLAGQANLQASLDGSLSFKNPDGKEYSLGDDLATIVVRPRGWHLPEKHVRVDGQPVSGGLFDFALYLVHCGQAQIDRGQGPYYYIP
ncbi:MAG: hypothetical protein ACRDO0_06435, partial [Nocardioidaceae bacterium]